jgi:hypothetical protein
VTREERIDVMLAHHEIREVLMRYARGVDRADGDLLKSCYHADAIEEHGSTYSGGAIAYIEAAVGRIAQMGTLAHYLCNIHIEITSATTAYVESYVLTFARFAKPEHSYDTFTGGRLVDRFEFRDGAWKIAHRKMAFDWNHDIATNETWCVGLFKPEDPKMIMGRKGTGDLSYSRF